jgi:endonuclease III
MVPAQMSFKNIIETLESHYGRPQPPPVSGALPLILYESIGYLVDDERREAAFEVLRRQVGLAPTDLLSASIEQLTRITKLGGIHSELRAQRLQEIARIVLHDCAGDLGNALHLPYPQAIKELRKFPSIGEPGAEKILLFTRTYPVLALESNGLRVLLRLGFGRESKNYSTSYHSVREALQDQVGDDCDFLIKAHQLLRQHGKELCKTNRPDCQVCPVVRSCSYYASSYKKGGPVIR